MDTSNALSYRPRNAGHDYYGRGTYLVTLVVSGREQLLSHFVTDLGHKTTLALTPLGEAVQEVWLKTPTHAQTHGNKIVLHACVCMPDHFHGVIEVLEPMQWSLGDVIQAFKATCTSWWQQQQGLPSSTNRPIPVDCRPMPPQLGCMRRQPFTLTKAPLFAACQRSSVRSTIPSCSASSARSSMTTTTTLCALTNATDKR